MAPSDAPLNKHCHNTFGSFFSIASGFTGRKPGIPIKFSVDLDLPEAECHKLLDQFTPQHMKKNKTLQKLFVK